MLGSFLKNCTGDILAACGMLGIVLGGIGCGTKSAFAQEEIKLKEGVRVIAKTPWLPVKTGVTSSFRGLHVVDRDVVWASGSQGTILQTYDGGKKWNTRKIEGAQELDFRDIHGFDEATAVTISAGTPARIYRTTNGGLRWKQVYQHPNPKAFFNSISFWDEDRGVVMGDPIDGKLTLLLTFNGGATWSPIPAKNLPSTERGEAGFAASGTNMLITADNRLMIGLGGHVPGKSKETSSLLVNNDSSQNWQRITVPMKRSESSGIFSIHFVDQDHGVAVGGDYRSEDDVRSNYAITKDGGRTWVRPNPVRPPSGYRSAVAKLVRGREIQLVAVGPNGTDLSTDLGASWRRVSEQGYHVVAFSPDGKIGWAAGADGRLAKWQHVPNLASRATTPSNRRGQTNAITRNPNQFRQPRSAPRPTPIRVQRPAVPRFRRFGRPR